MILFSSVWIFKVIIKVENYIILFSSFMRKDKRYFFTIMAMDEIDINQALNIFEELYIDRIYNVIE